MIKYLLFCWYVILFLSCCEEERPGYATRELIFWITEMLQFRLILHRYLFM